MANIIRRNDRRGTSNDLAPMLSGRWDPFQIFRDIASFDPYREVAPALTAEFAPRFDVKETRDKYIFTADLPGVREGDVEIYLTGNQLTVSGQREQEQQQEGEQYHAFERSYGTFMRTFALPEGADADNVQAELKDGVLRIIVGKRPEIQPRRVSVLGAAKEMAKEAKNKIVEVAESAKEKMAGGGDQGASKGTSASSGSAAGSTPNSDSNPAGGEPATPKSFDKNKPEK
jgi:HSP20 family protein